MPYVSRKKYKSRREKRASSNRTIKIVTVTIVILSVVLLVVKWTYIKDYVLTSFY